MTRYIQLLFLLFLSSLSGRGQQTFTEHLRLQKPGQGKVVVIQDGETEALVNGTVKVQPFGKKAGEEHKPTTADISAKHKFPETYVGGTRQRYKAQGYRIQIYTGGNSRADKLEAQKMERKCHAAFPELSVYTHFISPRWICRVGDFRSLEEAQKYVKLIKAAKVSYEVQPVKCTVLLAY